MRLARGVCLCNRREPTIVAFRMIASTVAVYDVTGRGFFFITPGEEEHRLLLGMGACSGANQELL